MFTTEINPVTGNKETTFEAKLVSISNKVLEFNNDNKTPYRVATIEFETANNELKQVSAIVYESNFSYGMTPGTTYRAKAIFTPGQAQPLITVSHLTASARATFDDFGFDNSVAVEVPTEDEVANAGY